MSFLLSSDLGIVIKTISGVNPAQGPGYVF
jgi:hypothetical protein